MLPNMDNRWWVFYVYYKTQLAYMYYWKSERVKQWYDWQVATISYKLTIHWEAYINTSGAVWKQIKSSLRILNVLKLNFCDSINANK